MISVFFNFPRFDEHSSLFRYSTCFTFLLKNAACAFGCKTYILNRCTQCRRNILPNLALDVSFFRTKYWKCTFQRIFVNWK